MAFTTPVLTRANIHTAIANAIGFDTTDTDDATRMDQAITAAGHAACRWQGRAWWFLKADATFYTGWGDIESDGLARATNVVTVTTAAAHKIVKGDIIRIADATSSTFDGTFTVASADTTTTLTYAQTDDNESSGGGTVSVSEYPLQTVNSSALADFWKPTQVMIGDDYDLAKSTKEEYLDYVTLIGTEQSEPLNYAIAGAARMYVWPVPDAVYTITVGYLRRHSLMDSSAGDTMLIVPGEFHYPVYVDGSLWLLRHDTVDPASLYESPQFNGAMERMAAADPSPPRFVDGDTDQRTLDATRKSFQTVGGLSV